MKAAPVITRTDDERQTLMAWSRGRSTPARLGLRARLGLAAAAGTSNQDSAAPQEWIHFLHWSDTQTPGQPDLQLLVDNYATPKHPKGRRWLARPPRFHVPFLPTSSSWLNLSEHWFREITAPRIRRGTFGSVPP